MGGLGGNPMEVRTLPVMQLDIAVRTYKAQYLSQQPNLALPGSAVFGRWTFGDAFARCI